MAKIKFVPFDGANPLRVRIRNLRAKMLIHSCLYYEMNTSIVDDHVWQSWADELERLQSKHPEHINIGFFDDEFKDWTGATGAHLPHREPWVYSNTLRVLRYHEKVLANSVPVCYTTESEFNGTLF